MQHLLLSNLTTVYDFDCIALVLLVAARSAVELLMVVMVMCVISDAVC